MPDVRHASRARNTSMCAGVLKTAGAARARRMRLFPAVSLGKPLNLLSESKLFFSIIKLDFNHGISKIILILYHVYIILYPR